MLTNKIIKDGGWLRLAAEALSIKLREYIKAGGKVELEDFTLRTVADVMALDKTTLLTGVQAALYLIRKAQITKK